MVIFDLVNRDKKIAFNKLLILGCISGLANALILAVINLAADQVGDEENTTSTLYYLALFLVTVGIYYLAQQRLMILATHHVENAIRSIRLSVVAHIRNCELQTIEQLGRDRIFAVMGKELQVISQSAQLFVIIAQSSILVFFTSLYIAWLSIPAFVIIASCIVLGAVVHFQRHKDIETTLNKSFQREAKLLSRLTDFLDGFKEIKLSRQRAEALEQEFNRDSKRVNIARRSTLSLFAKDFVASQLNFYLGISAVVFLVPILSEADPEMITKVTTATLFLVGPITGIVGGLPSFASSNTAAKNILSLEQELSDIGGKSAQAPIFKDFNEIVLRNLHFQHISPSEEKAFAVGPINLTIKKGQTLFVTGGNGSGKTTFIRLLTGLYPADSGEILLDGIPISGGRAEGKAGGRVVTEAGQRVDAYRNLFSSVFADFHLFKHLYGLDPIDQEAADYWLNYLEMGHKVQLEGDEYSTVDLSGGQRKRLALHSAILENRPIYIFDEWAADQDPYFRQKFYLEVLPKLKAAGQTVIAITHDDKYFDVADIHVKMEEGQLHYVKPRRESLEQPLTPSEA